MMKLVASLAIVGLASATPGCKRTTGFDYRGDAMLKDTATKPYAIEYDGKKFVSGGDYHVYKFLTVAQCEAKCAATPGCVYWTKSKSSRCSLKSTYTKKKRSKNHKSGTCPRNALPTPQPTPASPTASPTPAPTAEPTPAPPTPAPKPGKCVKNCNNLFKKRRVDLVCMKKNKCDACDECFPTPSPTPSQVPSSDPTPSPTPATPLPSNKKMCVREVNIDWRGGNIEMEKTGSQDICERKCINHTQCRYYTFTKGKCFLKDSTAKRKGKKNHRGAECKRWTV